MKLSPGKIQIIACSYLLSAIFLSPGIIKLAHIFEHSHEKIYKESKTHLHEKDSECEIDLFVFSPVLTFYNSKNIKEIILPFNKVCISFSNEQYKSVYQFKKWRGPPTT